MSESNLNSTESDVNEEKVPAQVETAFFPVTADDNPDNTVTVQVFSQAMIDRLQRQFQLAG